MVSSVHTESDDIIPGDSIVLVAESRLIKYEDYYYYRILGVLGWWSLVEARR